MKKFTFLFLLICNFYTSNGQNATITETSLSMKTYMFSEPDPVPNISRIYPYFRFDSYAKKGEKKNWKMVVLENKYIKVYVCPSVGGKIWGAIEKSTGKEFLYFNDVVKFRDVAMRGAWTSGGLEYNFGDIGHIPTCATPVDYVIKKNKDGSVSCTVGALDLPSRTKWNVEISLDKDKAFFETKVSWFNNSSLPVTYYHWMNAAAKAKGNLEFIYPGTKRIGHGGELDDWPIDNNRDISKYENNNFGVYKSYHVLNSYADFFGGYWHDDDFGFGHYATYDDKPGKKIWIWGLSDQGMIWKDLLTDSKGQYVEYQSGKMFNQAANSSTNTPYKHKEFSPFDTDIMHELWFPIKGTKGMVAASEYGALNIERNENTATIFLSPLQPLNTELFVKVGTKNIFTKKINQKTLDLFTTSFSIDSSEDFKVLLGDNLLVYNSNEKSNHLNRPTDPALNFNWTSAYGIYIKGLELEKQRRYIDAQAAYLESYKQEPTFSPTLNRLALTYYRLDKQKKALEYANKSLSIDTYNGLANYLYGLINVELGNTVDAKSGFSIAAQSISLRSASYTELSKLFLNENNLNQASKYAQKALNFNTFNNNALEINALISRKKNNKNDALKTLTVIDEMDATSHFKNFELVLNNSMNLETFKKQISNEFPFQSYLELASKYMKYGCKEEALKVLKIAPKNAIVHLWKAYLDTQNENSLLTKTLAFSPEMVFPYRKETGKILNYFLEKRGHWKLKYYLALQQWNKGNIENAKSLFQQCKNIPNTSSFYLAKIKLFDFNDAITHKALQRANEIDSKNWRVQLAWIKYYAKTNQFTTAKKTAKETFKKHPDKAVIGMLYAKTLIKLKEYNTCLKFLEKFEVLPFEGATEGRTIYHETCIRLATNAFSKKNYSKAIKYAKKATLWPKNLGVGKHYDVDERLDTYLIAHAYEKLGDKKMATLFYSKIAAHKTPGYLNESSKLYFQLKVLQKLNQQKALSQLKEKYLNKSKGNPYLKWAFLKFKNNNSDQLKNEILNSKTKALVYDTKFIDREFRLVIDIISKLD